MRHGLRLILATTVVVLMPASFRPVQADFVTVSYMSQPGDFVGGGQTFNFTYTPANSTLFTVQDTQYIGGEPSFISFALATDPSGPNRFTILDFGTNELGTPLEVGTYTNVQRAAFATAGHAGLDVSFQNRGSNIITGNFTINSISFFTDSSHVLEVGSLDVNFEQHSEGAIPALFGHLVYVNSSAVPEPSSMALCGIAGAIGLAVARVRRWRIAARD
jgi:PEP-CTERM motif